MTALLIAVSDSEFRGNTFLNDNRPANTSAATSNGGTEEWFGPGKQDLPMPNATLIAVAFVLGRTHQATDGTVHYAINNSFIGNHMSSTNAGAAGLGWFTGRDTGFGAGGAWDPVTTANVFRRQQPLRATIYGATTAALATDVSTLRCASTARSRARHRGPRR